MKKLLILLTISILILITGCNEHIYTRIILTNEGSASVLSFERKDAQNESEISKLTKEGYVQANTFLKFSVDTAMITLSTQTRNDIKVSFYDGMFFADYDGNYTGISDPYREKQEGWGKTVDGTKIIYSGEKIPFNKISDPEELAGLILMHQKSEVRAGYGGNIYTKYINHASYIPIKAVRKLAKNKWALIPSKKIITKELDDGFTWLFVNTNSEKTMKSIHRGLLGK